MILLLICDLVDDCVLLCDCNVPCVHYFFVHFHLCDGGDDVFPLFP